jgi:hypothetical protein
VKKKSARPSTVAGYLRAVPAEQLINKLDMGKACIRFRTLDDLPLDTIAAIIASTPVDAYVAAYEESRKDL